MINLFQTILLICMIQIFLSQTCSNYRENTTDYLTTIKMTLLNFMYEFNFIKWIWCFEAMFVMMFSGLVIVISVSMQYQIKYLERNTGETEFKTATTNNSPWIGRMDLSTNYVSLLTLPTINWIAFRFSFESMNCHSWTAKFIGTMAQLIVDSTGCIHQIIIIDRARSMMQYTIAFVTIDIANMLLRIITVCLREHNQTTTLVLFTCLILFQLIMIMIKLRFFCSEMLMDNKKQLESHSDSNSSGEYLYWKSYLKHKNRQKLVSY